MDIYSLIEFGDKGEVVGIEPLEIIEIIEINSPEQLAEILGLPLTDLEISFQEAAK